MKAVFDVLPLSPALTDARQQITGVRLTLLYMALGAATRPVLHEVVCGGSICLEANHAVMSQSTIVYRVVYGMYSSGLDCLDLSLNGRSGDANQKLL